jgi:hypothetical protein
MLEFWDGTKMNSQATVQYEINLHKEGGQCKLDARNVMDLVGTTSNSSFIWPATFGRKHHSPPYSMLCDSPQGLQTIITFFLKTPKIRILTNPKFWCLYIPFKSSLFGACEGNIL